MIPLAGPRIAVAAGWLVALLGMPATVRSRETVFVGYLYGSTAGVDYALYTHVCHAFVVADADGRVRPNARVPSRDVAAAAHKAGCRVLISLGGWGWDDQFAAIVKSAEAEDRYVAAVLKLVEDFDYDGLDLDWEYPDTEVEVPAFERLVDRLRAGLDAIETRTGRRLALTMAVSANPGTLRWLRPAFMIERFDWLNVMTYDMTGDWTSYAGHNAPLRPSSRQPEGAPVSVETTFRHLLDEQRYPPDKLALGIPLYGRGANVGEPYASKKDAPKRPLPRGDFKNLANLLGEEGWSRVWDDETKVPWLIAPDRAALFAYDDPESVVLKARFAREAGLRGVFFWEIQADRLPDGTTPLQAAARAALFD